MKKCLKCGQKYDDPGRSRCDCGGPLLYIVDPSLNAAPLRPKTKEDYVVVRSPRLASPVEAKTIALEKPPSAGGPPQINWLSVLLTPAISIVLMLVLVKVLGMSPVMLLMSGVMSVVSAFIAVVSYLRQKKKSRQTQEKITAAYRQYLDDTAKKIREKHDLQKSSLLRANPSPEECLEIVRQRETRLWERRPGDSDFMSVRLGTGTIPAAVTAAFKRPQVVIEENALEIAAESLANGSKTIDEAPIQCDLLHCKSIGIVGERAGSIRLVQNMVMEAATAHAYTDLQIVALFPENERADWEWIKWLPHSWDSERKTRRVFTSPEDAKSALDTLEEVLMNRKGAEEKAAPGSETAELLPHYLFVIAGTPWIERHSIRRLLLSEARLGCSALFVYDRLGSLPMECGQIIETEQGSGKLYKRTDSANKTAFSIDALSRDERESFARSMAPLMTGGSCGAASLPASISFLQGYGVTGPEQLNIAERWERADTAKSLAVPIAALPGGGSFLFDIHKEKHGVHGLVAGMTGSGKTEMVQSWILSMAVHFSPQDVSFVLIDFKGTGLLAPFKNLPHLAGSISNLDENIDRNLTALRSEIHRREAILDKYAGLGIKNVNDLNRAYRQNAVPEKLPILIVIIDEFAEFKKNYPDFGVEINSLVATGLALGIFVVLMTQKPAGVVNPLIEDNIKFRWCLQVANVAASREMLGTPDAARITTPGRAYIKVGEDELYEQVQAFWSGAPYRPSRAGEKEQAPISRVELDGKRIPCEQIRREDTSPSFKNEIDVVVQYIADYCAANGIANAERVWTDRLPERLLLGGLIKAPFDGKTWPAGNTSSAVIGLVDDPAHLTQDPLVLDLSKCGHTVVYGAPVSGKTTLLQTLIMSLALTKRPDELSIYIMDFGGWSMGIFRDLPHVGGIANDNEPERLKKLMLLLDDILQERRSLFSRAGVGNISAYRSLTHEAFCQVLF